ncbi:MAG: transcription antitermination factor NusB [Patescibacteria group bacterium]|jgi:N utilization substance protein B|nr:transcription antitermination factor NusB [Patescibacteria group bacterium]
MSNRHLSRTIAMQTLFVWDFNHHKNSEIDKIIQDNFANFAPDFDDSGYVKYTIDGIFEHLEEIDNYIRKYATEWPLEQITYVDRNILRLGIFELIYAEKIPPKVAINEAIEIAKAFGSDSSSKFVNGVLGSIFNDLPEELRKADFIAESEEETKKTEEESK